MSTNKAQVQGVGRMGISTELIAGKKERHRGEIRMPNVKIQSPNEIQMLKCQKAQSVSISVLLDI